MSVIASNLQAIHRRMASACTQAQRLPGSVRLVAVSKSFDAQAVVRAAAAGQRDFGENYLQEALPKMEEADESIRQAGGMALTWHMIGPLQSNKTRQVAEHFDWVHSLDRLKIAERLSQQRPPARGPLKVLLQVNISREASKSGVDPDALVALAQAVDALPQLALCGLMAIPARGDDGAFTRLAHLRDELARALPRLTELSMGMSADLETAIAAGATLIRVGTAIFGQRRPADVLLST